MLNFRSAARLNRRDHHRQIFRLASGHHRGDGDFLERNRRILRRLGADDFLRVPPRAVKHPKDALRCRWYDRESIIQSLREHEFEWVIVLANLDAACAPSESSASAGRRSAIPAAPVSSHTRAAIRGRRPIRAAAKCG